MQSPNFLKPWQLQTVMSYAETQYHSNDYQFITIMADVLMVVKLQIKLWKDDRIKSQVEDEEMKVSD